MMGKQQGAMNKYSIKAWAAVAGVVVVALAAAAMGQAYGDIAATSLRSQLAAVVCGLVLASSLAALVGLIVEPIVKQSTDAMRGDHRPAKQHLKHVPHPTKVTIDVSDWPGDEQPFVCRDCFAPAAHLIVLTRDDGSSIIRLYCDEHARAFEQACVVCPQEKEDRDG